ncbi:MAG: saccharopine dehydrogenase NADP-binding domain-containing protein, partial [Candidatus Omnitrophota bacterium]
MLFKNKVLMIGYGSVAQCALPVLLKHLNIPYENLCIIDFLDKTKELRPWIQKGIRFSQVRIAKDNYARVLAANLEPGGLLIDLAWNIESADILQWCHDHQVLYVNTSVEEWNPQACMEKRSPFEKSLYFKQMQLRRLVSRWTANSVTAVVDHGANPGLISHFVKQGLVDIAQKCVGNGALTKKQKAAIERSLKSQDFPRLSMHLGVKVIHVSERDTQLTNKPKQVDEFVGTWSIEGLREEGTAPSEIGWGTHEPRLPELAHEAPYGPKNQIFLSQMGMNTWVRSWVPDQEIIGMVIRHAEAFSISDRLTVSRGGRVLYRPTVHYAYMPCDATIASLLELRSRNYEVQPQQRIMNDEITGGEDILGALLLGHRYNAWWTGSILSIEESRALVPHQNATTVQVAIGVVSAVLWMTENPRRGL